MLDGDDVVGDGVGSWIDDVGVGIDVGVVVMVQLSEQLNTRKNNNLHLRMPTAHGETLASEPNQCIMNAIAYV